MSRIFDGETGRYSLPLEPRTTKYGCGIYGAGDKCYVKLFVTDTGRVIPLTGRMLREEDLMEVYTWGLIDGHGDSVVAKWIEESE